MKIKIDENLPTRLVELLGKQGHDVHTVLGEGLTGSPDETIWRAACGEGRFLITQDLDFADTRRFAPGTHPGVLLVRLREPGANALVDAIGGIAGELEGWRRCFVVLTEHKVRVKRPS